MLPPMHLSAAAAITPSGVPPMPSRMSTGVPSLATSIAAPTSPSLMSRMRTPASRHSRMMSACRGRSRMTAVTSLSHQDRRSLTARRPAGMQSPLDCGIASLASGTENSSHALQGWRARA